MVNDNIVALINTQIRGNLFAHHLDTIRRKTKYINKRYNNNMKKYKCTFSFYECSIFLNKIVLYSWKRVTQLFSFIIIIINSLLITITS